MRTLEGTTPYNNNETPVTRAAARCAAAHAARSQGVKVGQVIAAMFAVLEFVAVYNIAAAIFGGAL
jgi:hypothetical protein